MAETLGSLVDKLTIKSIREFYLQKSIKSKKSKFSQKESTSEVSTVSPIQTPV